MNRFVQILGYLCVADCVWLVGGAIAIEPTPPAQELPDKTSVVVPTSTLDLSHPPLEPISDPDFELPSSQDLEFQPLYPEPIYIRELPLRLEIQLKRRQVALYRGKTLLKRYPIAVGKPGWETPKGTFQVKQMFRNPTWVHPLKKGIVIPGGDPENPLGRYWIGFWTDGKNWIGFHGTPNPQSVGRAVSHGCIRMYNKDIEELFKKVSLGTEVKVVN